MTKLRVALAEDEPPARRRLARLLEASGCTVAASFEDGASLLQWLQNHPPVDALFLDISMPGPSGMDVAAQLPYPVPVVFVTAHRDRASDAFDLEAVDFVLKPVAPDRLARAVERLEARRIPPRSGAELHALLYPPTRFPVKAGEGTLFLNIQHVSHFALEGEAVWAFAGGRSLRTPWKNLTDVEARFPDLGLMRIQRDLLLRPEAVIGHRPHWGDRLSLRVEGGLELIVSRRMAPKVRMRLESQSKK